ncbi:MAG: methyltransferase domain-containing protein [Planctomycetota bacterium]
MPVFLRHRGLPLLRPRKDGYALPFASGSFDLVLVRHLLQAVEQPVALLREAGRVLRPGGRAHLLVEDYAAVLFDIEEGGLVDCFAAVTPLFRRRGTDLYQGRRAYRQLREAGFGEVSVAPIVVDTLNTDREVFASIFRHWRDGYAATLAGMLGKTEPELRRRFDLRIEAALDPGRYAAWLLFAVTGVRAAS